ncbi:SRPBCC family protein [Streptomyces sp. Lzd4kr]|nr:SRPBCC family protein [Streptomyces sp. Lzd4kr]
MDLAKSPGGLTTFRVQSSIWIAAPAEQVYDTVSDLPRSGQWSPECKGGRWVSGEPGTVGAIFRGENVRDSGVISWAPVIRGAWQTESEIVEASGRVFRWNVLDSSRNRQESVWSYEIQPMDGGCRLTHHYWLGEPTEGLSKIFEGLGEADRRRFVDAWAAKLARDVLVTVQHIKALIESS